MSAAGNILAQAATQPPPGADALIGPYVGVFVAAFVTSLLLTPVFRRLARYFGVVDQPGTRKLHREPVPYLGGVAIFLGWLAGMTSCLFVAPTHSEHVGVGVAALPLSVIFGAAVITLVGLVDDVYGVSPRVKLGGQLLAAAALANDNLGLILVQSTLSALGISHPSFYFCYIAGAALIALLVLGGCNAMNLMDGLDGLAAGVAAIAQVGFLAIAVTAVLSVHRDPDLAGSDPLADVSRIVLCLATLGAVLGFLPFNFNPASIFMGDTGSLLLGYLSMSAILLYAQAATKAPGFFAAGLIVFSLPIIDTILAIVRRRLRGVSISTADKQHIHHLLLARWERLGVGPQMRVKLTAFGLYAVAALLAVSGYVVAQLRVRYALGVTLVYFAFVVVTAYKSGQRIVAAERLAALTPAAPAAAAAAPTPPAHSPTSKAS